MPRSIQVVDEVLELLMDLDANDKQLDCPFVYASAKTGTATTQITVFRYLLIFAEYAALL